MKKTSVTFLGVWLLAEIVTGAPRVICPTQPIEAEEGDDVTLQCKLDPLIDVSAYTADWKRVDLNKVVYSYRNKRDHHDAQMKRYRGRTTFIYEDLSRGILTLRLSSLQLSDSGPYRCFVPKLRASCVINISVVPKDEQNGTKRGGDTNTTKPPVEDVTKSDDPDGENKTAVYASISAVALLCIVIAVVVALFKCGIIQKCIERLQGKNKEKQDEEANGSEMEELNTPK